MSLIRISESDDFIVDYDKPRGMYRVTAFADNHYWDEYWFDAYEEREERGKDVPLPIIRFENPIRDDAWWCGYCPRCDQMLYHNYHGSSEEGHRKQYCWHCGQLVDFELDTQK